jgi:glycerol uptake facilitator protein
MSHFLGEFMGTALLIILGDGVVANVILYKTKGNNSGWIVITLGWAMAVFVAVFVASWYSFAHLNPAVTIGMAAAEKMDWSLVPTYIGGQFAGAFAGAVIVWITYHSHFEQTEDKDTKLAVFCTGPAIRKPFNNLITEVIGTFILVFGAFHILPPASTLGGLNALTVALLVLAIGISLGGPTGYAINPARDLAPRIAHSILPIKNKGNSDWGYSWIPVVGPILGGLLAAFVFLKLV